MTNGPYSERSNAELTRDIVRVEDNIREHKAVHVTIRDFEYIATEQRAIKDSLASFREEVSEDRKRHQSLEESRTKERRAMWAAIWIVVLTATLSLISQIVIAVVIK